MGERQVTLPSMWLAAMDRCGFAALLGLSIVFATSPVGPQPEGASAQPVDVPPAVYETIGELHCSPPAVAAGGTLRCIATGAEGLDQLHITFRIWAPGTTTSEGYEYHSHRATVAVGPQGTATVSFAVPDGRPGQEPFQYWPGDFWEVSAGGWGGPCQDCYAIDRATGDLLATGSYVPPENPAVIGSDSTVLDPGDGIFTVGGHRFEFEEVEVRCTDDIDFGAGDDGEMLPTQLAPDRDAGVATDADPTEDEESDPAEDQRRSAPTETEPRSEAHVDAGTEADAGTGALDRAVDAGRGRTASALVALGAAVVLLVVALLVVRLRVGARR